MASKKSLDPKVIERRENARKAAELRKAGASFESIATNLGYKNAAAAASAVGLLLARLEVEEADGLRAIELERLNDMQRALWPQVKNGHIGASQQVLRIMGHRAELMGLNRVVPVPTVDFTGWSPEEIRAWMAEYEAQSKAAGKKGK